MLNSMLKKNVIEELNRTNRKYNDLVMQSVQDSTILHETRLATIRLLKDIEKYISQLENYPEKYDTTIGMIKKRTENFGAAIEKLERDSKSTDKVGGTVVGAGLFAATSIAAFGPSAAMAVAMTFGTASTGTAIATLSGAAATNAALAWLGGGALAAGGAGIVGGQAFLSLAGPIGWAIGGVAIAGGGIYVNYKNKKIANNAKHSIDCINSEIVRIEKTDMEIKELFKTTSNMNGETNSLYSRLKFSGINDYTFFSEEQKNSMWKLMSLSEMLSKYISIIPGDNYEQ